MTKKCFASFLFVLFFLPGLSYSKEFNAVGLTLGEPIKSVLEKFNNKGIKELLKEKNQVVFENPLIQLKGGGKTELDFFENKLIGIKIYISLENNRFQEFKKSYDRLKNILIEKYGRPIKRKELIPPSYDGNISPTIIEEGIGYGVIFENTGVRIKLMLQTEKKRRFWYFLQYEDIEKSEQKKKRVDNSLEESL
ncbi:MAG: hypothetical protein HQK84_01580 [Nitrospinae bacterium]|nr:hypothetical protein [Nitrospinota bacterium]